MDNWLCQFRMLHVTKIGGVIKKTVFFFSWTAFTWVNICKTVNFWFSKLKVWFIYYIVKGCQPENLIVWYVNVFVLVIFSFFFSVVFLFKFIEYMHLSGHWFSVQVNYDKNVRVIWIAQTSGLYQIANGLMAK